MPFDIIVIGAGLGGLSAALFLRRHGHNVTVVEASKQLSEVGAGIQMPPNCNRLLCHYGLAEKFKPVVVEQAYTNLRRYEDGSIIGTTQLVPQMVEKYGYPYWVVHRADYQRILHEAAIEAGVTVRVATRVDSIDTAAVSVHLEDGTTLHADLIIGADGIRSKVRTALLGSDDVSPVASPTIAYRAVIPAAKMLSDPRSAELLQSPASNNWIGPGRHFVAYAVHGGSQYNVVMPHPGQASVGKWTETGSLDDMHATYSAFDPVVRLVLSYIDEAPLKWMLADLPRLPTWRSRNGRVVLLGDAAHAQLPFMSQGAAQAVEDAAVLAECLDRAARVADIARVTEVYERMRMDRADRTRLQARRNGQVWHLPDGEEQQRRDRAMQGELRQGEQDPNIWADKTFQPWLYGYDAIASAHEHLDEAGLMAEGNSGSASR